jgi:hypothetical protein
LLRGYFEGLDVVVVVEYAGADRWEVPAAERRSLDAAAKGPLHTATVAAMPHNTLAAIRPPRCFLICALLCPNI